MSRGHLVEFELLPDNRGADDATLLGDLCRVAQLLGTDSVKQYEYERLGRFHPKTLANRFGTWNRTLKRAGLAVTKTMNLTRQDCLSDLQRVAALLGQTCVTVAEYRVHGKYSESPFRKLFGSWATALADAGLAVSEYYRVRPPDPELFENMERVWRAVGRQPRQSDFREPLSAISAKSYTSRFGSWRASLEAFVAYVSVDRSPAIGEREPPTPQASLLPPRQSSRSVPWRLRFLVMRRDRFRCRACGATPALKPDTVLVIDHLVAWSKGGETVYDNLQTLCEVCNGGKGDLVASESIA